MVDLPNLVVELRARYISCGKAVLIRKKENAFLKDNIIKLRKMPTAGSFATSSQMSCSSEAKHLFANSPLEDDSGWLNSMTLP